MQFNSSVYFSIKLWEGWVFKENHCSSRGTSVTGSIKVRLRFLRSSAVRLDMAKAVELGGDVAEWDKPGM